MQSDCQGVKLSPHRTVKQRERGPSITASEPNVPRRMVLAAALTAIASEPALEGQLVREASLSKTTPLHYIGLLQLAERLRKRELSPVEVTNAQLARIAALEPKLMAFDTITADRAIAQAKIAEREIRAGRYLGPLHGVPIAVKDLFFTNGVSTRGGLKVYANHTPRFDATAVERLLRAGAVLVGKLSMAEGAGGGYHRDFRVPRNPWAANRWPGVSSSGSGVATAAGLCYASLATDTGGSIRQPSAANGVVGLKPTWGRVSRHGTLDFAPSLDHVGPMARRVGDVAVVLGIIAGYDSGDPTSLSSPVPDYLAETSRGIKGVRVGFDENYATAGIAPHMADAVREAVHVLEKLGTRVVPVRMPVFDLKHFESWFILASSEAAAVHEANFPSRADDYGAGFRDFLEGGRKFTGRDYARASFVRVDVAGRIRQAFGGIDVLACPTMMAEAFVYDPEKAYEGPIRSASGVPQTLDGAPFPFVAVSGRFTAPYSLNGFPTLSMPCGASPDGMPLSLQLIGHPLAESMLCRVGYAYEQSSEWHLRHPPV
jgi:amidase